MKNVLKILLFIITLPIWIILGLPVGIVMGIQLGEEIFF